MERGRDGPLARFPVRHTSVLSHVDVFTTLWTNDIHKGKYTLFIKNKFHYCLFSHTVISHNGGFWVQETVPLSRPVKLLITYDEGR